MLWPLIAVGLNGANILFNLFVTVGNFNEPMWPMEALTASIANSYVVGDINLFGIKVYPRPFTSSDGKPTHTNFGHFYRVSYFTALDASCTPCLSRYQNGLMIAYMNLNLCQQLELELAYMFQLLLANGNIRIKNPIKLWDFFGLMNLQFVWSLNSPKKILYQY